MKWDDYLLAAVCVLAIAALVVAVAMDAPS